jgi:hypothetical protein
MRTFRLVVVLVGVLVVLGMAGLAEAQVVGPLCSHATAGLGGLSINVRIFAIPTGGDQYLLTGVGVESGVGGGLVRSLSGSAVVTGTTSLFQVTVAGASSPPLPTLFISGEVDNTTGDGGAFCESVVNVQTPAGCTTEGIGLTLTRIAC